jgi:hypothetical protein
MDAVSIIGPKHTLQRILDVEGLELWEVSGYATEDAIKTLEARGCTVTVIPRGVEKPTVAPFDEGPDAAARQE